MSPAANLAFLRQLRSSLTCPHCWHKFPPEEIVWISAHSDLIKDPLLGQDHQERFLPTRFTVDCKALDRKGVACRRLACPHCHLSISPSFLELEPLFLSILGAPFSGKSYFLASMTWKLRKSLHTHFSLSFQDDDPEANQALAEYERKLFHNPNPDDLVALPKTEREGSLYESVRYHEREVWYPRPFVFSIQPEKSHPAYVKRDLLSRTLCLYDNAGEHFLPGGETANSPGTQHLALSQALLFLFDPTQHPHFRAKCTGRTKDPQMTKEWHAHPQHSVLWETAKRIREAGQLSHSQKYPRPLLVIVAKYDAWCNLVHMPPLESIPVVHSTGPQMAALDLDVLHDVSKKVRRVLEILAPEMVTAAESFAEHVTYVPVSATGSSPEVDPRSGSLGVRPKCVEPLWAEIPMLYALHRAAGTLIRGGSRRASESAAQAASPRLWRETGT